MDRLLNVATPLTALEVVLPLRVPPLGLVAIARLIDAVLLVTVLPRLSWTVTVTAGLMATVDTVSVGCWLKTSLFAAPGVMLELVLGAVGRPGLAAGRV